MQQAVYYHPATGAISQYVSGDATTIELNAPADREILYVDAPAHPNTHYVSDGELVERPTMGLSYSSLSIGVDEELVIFGVPDGCYAYYPGGMLEVEDNELIFSSAVPARVRLSFEKFPYQTERLYVEITA
jgi:hypothetical protein